MYRDQRNYENLNRAKFIGAGAFDIPRILAEVPATPQSWIGFNYAKSCKDPANKAVHFFVDDYQFNRLWTTPDAYLDMLRRFKAVCTPDFQPIRTSRKPFKSGTITASIGSARIGKATGSRLFRPSLGATKAASSGALTVNLWVALWPFPVLERSLTSAPQSFSGSAMMKCSAV